MFDEKMVNQTFFGVHISGVGAKFCGGLVCYQFHFVGLLLPSNSLKTINIHHYEVF